MKALRLKHLPTGLYYKPVNNSYPKSNLSKHGKVYLKNVPIGCMDSSFYKDGKLLPFLRNEWIQEEVK